MIKRVLADGINPQAIPLDVLITALHELHIRETFEMVDTRTNMQLADLNFKPRGGKSLQNIIDCSIGVIFYTLPGSLHYQQLCICQFHETTHIDCEKNKKSEIKTNKISSAHISTTKSRAGQI